MFFYNFFSRGSFSVSQSFNDTLHSSINSSVERKSYFWVRTNIAISNSICFPFNCVDSPICRSHLLLFFLKHLNPNSLTILIVNCQIEHQQQQPRTQQKVKTAHIFEDYSNSDKIILATASVSKALSTISISKSIHWWQNHLVQFAKRSKPPDNVAYYILKWTRVKSNIYSFSQYLFIRMVHLNFINLFSFYVHAYFFLLSFSIWMWTYMRGV